MNLDSEFSKQYLKLIELFRDKPTLLNDVRDSILLTLNTHSLKNRFSAIVDSLSKLVGDQDSALLFFLDILDIDSNSGFINNFGETDKLLIEELIHLKKMYGRFITDSRNATIDPFNFREINMYRKDEKYTMLDISRMDGECLKLQLDIEHLTCLLDQCTRVYLNTVNRSKSSINNKYTDNLMKNLNSMIEVLNKKLSEG